MADLLIRYVNGKRTVAIDFAGAKRQEVVLHNKSRERRIPIPDSAASLPINDLVKMLLLDEEQ